MGSILLKIKVVAFKDSMPNDGLNFSPIKMRLIQLITAQSNSLGHAHMEEFHTQKILISIIELNQICLLNLKHTVRLVEMINRRTITNHLHFGENNHQSMSLTRVCC